MDTLDFVWKLVESQGLVATMLAFLIWQNSREKTQLLHKICELNHFIMKCLENELNEDHPVLNVVVPDQKVVEMPKS